MTQGGAPQAAIALLMVRRKCFCVTFEKSNKTADLRLYFDKNLSIDENYNLFFTTGAALPVINL